MKRTRGKVLFQEPVQREGRLHVVIQKWLQSAMYSGILSGFLNPAYEDHEHGPFDSSIVLAFSHQEPE